MNSLDQYQFMCVKTKDLNKRRIDEKHLNFFDLELINHKLSHRCQVINHNLESSISNGNTKFSYEVIGRV